MNFPYRSPFSLHLIINWVATNNPAEVGLNDNQYACFANLSGANKKDVKGVPIKFLGS
jgi:hypothetical protein